MKCVDMGHKDEENPVVEAVEEAEKAVEVLVESDPPPAHHGDKPRWTDKAKSLAAITTAMAALIAAFGAFAKTCDHSVTESAYNALSANITKLSDQEQKNQQDIAQLRGYLDGLSHAPILPSPAPPATASTVPAPGAVRHPHPAPLASSAAATPQDAGVITFAIVPPADVALPPARPPAAPVKPTSFEKAVESK